ncbi:MAG: sarcosine oxidase subunit gamma family protein [Octadecabacter sp.]
MDNLIATTPCAGLLPITVGALILTEVEAGVITSVAPHAGQDKPVSAALKSAIGIALPAANRTTSKGSARAMWFGNSVAFVMGVAVPDVSGAALTDQSDAWAIVQLDGAGAEDVLTRLVPVDLRAAHFKKGHTARTMLAHMTASVTRTGAQTFEIMVMRSMAKTLVHDLSVAMTGVSARG